MDDEPTIIGNRHMLLALDAVASAYEARLSELEYLVHELQREVARLQRVRYQSGEYLIREAK